MSKEARPETITSVAEKCFGTTKEFSRKEVKEVMEQTRSFRPNISDHPSPMDTTEELGYLSEDRAQALIRSSGGLGLTYVS